MFRHWLLQPVVGAIRRSLPLRLRFRLTWARMHRRPDYLWMAYPELARLVLGQLIQSRLGYLPDLVRPRTFSEKVQWRKMHDRRSLLSLVVDKYRVRDYVSALIGDRHLVPLLRVCRRPAEIPFASLRVPYIVKPNNGSGMKIIVRDPACVDTADTVRRLRLGMREVYGLSLLEWAYATVPPRVLVEQLMLDRSGRLPRDYKFHVFGGRVAYLHVDQDREMGLRTVTYDRDWQPVALQQHGIPAGVAGPPPPNAESMLALAEKLAAGLEYARVDLYNLDGQIYFGEITIYPDSGLRAFEPPEWDRRWGDLWTLPNPATPGIDGSLR